MGGERALTAQQKTAREMYADIDSYRWLDGDEDDDDTSHSCEALALDLLCDPDYAPPTILEAPRFPGEEESFEPATANFLEGPPIDDLVLARSPVAAADLSPWDDAEELPDALGSELESFINDGLDARPGEIEEADEHLPTHLVDDEPDDQPVPPLDANAEPPWRPFERLVAEGERARASSRPHRIPAPPRPRTLTPVPLSWPTPPPPKHRPDLLLSLLVLSAALWALSATLGPIL